MTFQQKKWLIRSVVILVIGVVAVLAWQRYGVRQDEGLASGNGRIEATEIDVSAKSAGRIYPTTHFLTVARGTFSKGLGFGDLSASFVPLLLAVPILIGLGAILLRKQES